jgi:hypothetical protein
MPEGGVPAVRVVEAFDEVEDGHLGLGLGPKSPSVQELAFQGGDGSGPLEHLVLPDGEIPYAVT